MADTVHDFRFQTGRYGTGGTENETIQRIAVKCEEILSKRILILMAEHYIDRDAASLRLMDELSEQQKKGDTSAGVLLSYLAEPDKWERFGVTRKWLEGKK